VPAQPPVTLPIAPTTPAQDAPLADVGLIRDTFLRPRPRQGDAVTDAGGNGDGDGTSQP
jgi:hypothetical protein